MKRLRAAYNNASRIMHYIPRNVSVRPHQVSHRVMNFDALLRNNLYHFLQRCASASNFFIRSLQMSDAFYKSSFFHNNARVWRWPTDIMRWTSVCVHGHNLVGDTGNVSPPLFQTGDIICHVPPTFFSLGFVFGEISKIKVMFVTFCVKSFSC